MKKQEAEQIHGMLRDFLQARNMFAAVPMVMASQEPDDYFVDIASSSQQVIVDILKALQTANSELALIAEYNDSGRAITGSLDQKAIKENPDMTVMDLIEKALAGDESLKTSWRTLYRLVFDKPLPKSVSGLAPLVRPIDKKLN